MANQSILLAIRRMWEYFTVPPHSDIGLPSEEHDPVGEFLEQQNRGTGLTEAETEVVTEGEALPMIISETEAENSQATVGKSLSAVEGPEAVPTTDSSESANEAVTSAADINQNDTEDEVTQEMTNKEVEQVENGALSQLADITTDSAQDKVAEETAKNGNQGGDDDLLDIFRSEKEKKETDTIHDSLADIDIQELLHESRDLMAELNARRYRKT